MNNETCGVTAGDREQGCEGRGEEPVVASLCDRALGIRGKG
jgi:hypothetical protein